jgi:pimeloyl-ACP methyl ester carboxylesterase
MHGSTADGAGRTGAGRRIATTLVIMATIAALLASTVGCNSSTTPAAAPSTNGSPATSSPAGSAPGTTPGSTPGSTPPGTDRRPTTPSTRAVPPDDGPVDPIDWKACDGSFECGTLTVPLDYADPTGDTIELAVVRRPATKGAKRVGSVFVNPGGPGGSGIEFVKSGAIGRGLTSSFDVVSWDPRGVGQSSPIVCNAGATAFRDLDWSPDDDTETKALDDAARTIADDCKKKAGDLLSHVATDDTVRDLDRLRRAVGDEKLTFLGFSYGTYIGERYAELFPTHVRALVLDGVVDPTASLDELLLGQTEALEKQMNELFGECAKRPSCPVDDPAAAYDELAAQVEKKPIGVGAHKLGPTALAFAAVSASYSPDSGDELLSAIDDALGGDPSLLQAIAADYFASSSYSSYLAILCTDTPHPVGSDEYTALADRLAEASPRFGAAIANEVRPCAFWPAPAVEPIDPVRAEGAPTILVVGNTGDVATPFGDAQKVAADLDDGVLLTYHGSGHTSYGKSACVDAAVNAYLISLETPAPDTSCN